jgi:hypothetical protein
MSTPDWIGWVATSVFLASYSCKSQGRLRLMQAGAALLWVAYGFWLQAVPIVVANLLVALVAAVSSFRGSARRVTSAEPDLSRIS